VIQTGDGLARGIAVRPKQEAGRTSPRARAGNV